MKIKLFAAVAVAVIATAFLTKDAVLASATKKVADDLTQERLEKTADDARKFLLSHQNFNDSLVFLIDMKVPIRKHRFFVYDLKRKQVMDQGLVSHGEGSHRDSGDLIFSNVNNSHCSSLGKYAIAASYNGRFGKSYKLHGLDNTNSNAFARNIVLHSYSDMADAEDTDPVFLSFGCPTVSARFFGRLESILDASDRKTLMWIYY